MAIAPSRKPNEELPGASKGPVFNPSVLDNRYLLRYVLPSQLGEFTNGSNARHWLTPTAISPEDTVSWLALPAPKEPRTHAMVLDPLDVLESGRRILGPRWVRLGNGIEYLLPDGFGKSSLVEKWEIEVR